MGMCEKTHKKIRELLEKHNRRNIKVSKFLESCDLLKLDDIDIEIAFDLINYREERNLTFEYIAREIACVPPVSIRKPCRCVHGWMCHHRWYRMRLWALSLLPEGKQSKPCIYRNMIQLFSFLHDSHYFEKEKIRKKLEVI